MENKSLNHFLKRLCTGLIETFKNTQCNKIFTFAELSISKLYVLEQWSDLIFKNLNWRVNCKVST